MKENSIKHFVLLLLMAIFLLQGGIGYWILQHKIWIVKKEMKALVLGDIEEDKLTPIHISQKEFNNIEWPEPWEFEYQGKMYDLSKKEIHEDGSVTLYALMDNEENELKDLVSSLVNKSSDQKQTHEQFDFFYKFQSQWLFENDEVEESLHSEINPKRFIFHKNFISSPHIRLNELPPNL